MKEQGAIPSAQPDGRRPGKSLILDELLPGWKRVGDYVWLHESLLPSAAAPVFDSSPLLAHGAKAEDFLYYDVETTGLSGGAGTIAFLVGIGRAEGKKLKIEQLFLSDYPGEREFLEHLLVRLRKDSVYVSYNGKSFDSQILRTRFIMNGMRYTFPSQLDLLHPARRLFGSLLESCRLGSIEEFILDTPRVDDIPSSEVPEIYFRFLDTGDPAPLKSVFDHHLQDIASLKRVLVHMQKVLRDPLHAHADPYRLGRWLLEAGYEHWEVLLRRALGEGSRQAGYLLGRQLKREGRWCAAEALWRDMRERLNDYRASVELAMLYEHRVKDLSRSLVIVEELIDKSRSDGTDPTKDRSWDLLVHRKQRLLKKIKRAAKS
ncbi:MAG: hypothetical protein CMN78_04695 [Spirochaetales bacterium]|nr:hypothetical protein [Spirochaetales bacterium]